MLPFLVNCEQQAPLLVELADGRFQVVTHEPLAPFMFGYGYLLVEASFAQFLSELGIERVQFEKAIIWDPSTKTEIASHVRLRIGQLFCASQINDLALKGLRFLTMNDEYYFVSPELKERIQQSPFSYLRFTEGLSRFA